MMDDREAKEIIQRMLGNAELPPELWDLYQRAAGLSRLASFGRNDLDRNALVVLVAFFLSQQAGRLRPARPVVQRDGRQRNRHVTVRVSESEFYRLRQRAQLANMSLTDFVLTSTGTATVAP